MELIGQKLFETAKVNLAEKVADAGDRLGLEISVGAAEGVELPELTITPLKPNFARSVAQVKVAGRTAGDLYVIVFRQGDSTGDFSEKYPDGSLILPEGEFSNGLNDVYPRSIPGYYPRPKSQKAEICIPLCNTWMVNENLVPYKGTELRILGLGKGEEGSSRIQLVDSSRSGYSLSSALARSEAPSFLTLGTDNFGRRVGDPHAVFNPSENVQVAGFLAVDSTEWLDLLDSFDPVNPY